MKCSGIINLICNKCCIKQQIPCRSFTQWDSVSEDESAGGKEIQNESILDHTCNFCQNKIEIIATIWKYPDVPIQKPDCIEIVSASGGKIVNHTCDCV
jgi:hypothetical protein